MPDNTILKKYTSQCWSSGDDNIFMPPPIHNNEDESVSRKTRFFPYFIPRPFLPEI